MKMKIFAQENNRGLNLFSSRMKKRKIHRKRKGLNFFLHLSKLMIKSKVMMKKYTEEKIGY
jgi:uncharacterized protein YbcV (DUF1398 family)